MSKRKKEVEICEECGKEVGWCDEDCPSLQLTNIEDDAEAAGDFEREN